MGYYTRYLYAVKYYSSTEQSWNECPNLAPVHEAGIAPAGGLLRFDLETMTSRFFSLGKSTYGTEPMFAPRVGLPPVPYDDIRPGHGWEHEADGYVLNYATDEPTLHSVCNVLDARTFGLVTKIEMPSRVPHGTHGTWVRGEDLGA